MTVPTPEGMQQLVDASTTLYSLCKRRDMIELQARMMRLKLQELQGQLIDDMGSLRQVLRPLMAQLEDYGYEPRGIPSYLPEEGDSLVPPKYAVHPLWVHHYDAGLYNTDTQTWDASLGDVPNWALLQIQP